MSKGLGRTQRRVLDVLDSSDAVWSVMELSRHLGVSRRSLEETVRSLGNRGLVDLQIESRSDRRGHILMVGKPDTLRRRAMWQVEVINDVNAAFFDHAMMTLYRPEVKMIWIKSLKRTIRLMEQSLNADQPREARGDPGLAAGGD